MLSAMAVVAVAVMLSAKPSLSRLKWLLILLILGAWGLVTSQALFYHFEPKTPLVTLLQPDTPVIGELTGGIYIYKEGAVFGAMQSLRLVITSCIALWVLTVSSLDEIIAGLEQLGLPPKLSITISASVRAIPQLVGEALEIYRIQRLRGLKVFSANPVRAVMSVAMLLRPLVAVAIRRSFLVADALASRGITIETLPKIRSTLPPMRSWEKALTALIATSAITIAVIKLVSVFL